MSDPNPLTEDLKLASIAWGFTLGFGTLTTAKAISQTIAIRKRTDRVNNTYMWLVWGMLIVNLGGCVTVWIGINGNVQPSLTYFFMLVTLWVPQVQFILQIIINRVGLLMPDRKKLRLLKYGVAFIITLVNISVYCIWIPARLNVSPTYIRLNSIWDRIEKGIFLLIDASLNFYFMYLVRTQLVKYGLTKYKQLFRFNAGIILVSISMDILIIALMSLPNDFLYSQFHPLAYTIKLNIEMNMAELIVKVVKESNPDALTFADSNPFSHSASLSLPSQSILPTTLGSKSHKFNIDTYLGSGDLRSFRSNRTF